MPREVTDGDGVRWTCVQAYAGLAQSADESGNADAARVDGEKDRYRVVCTPSGGAQTVELELPGDWEEGLDDEALLKELEAARPG
ncbi:MAG TPA: hypothetical protein VF613_21025 [Longimicrobium sp.]